VDESFYYPIDDCKINILGTLNILLLAEQYKIPVIIFSSSAIYGINDDLLTEDTPPEPISFYGVSKASAELYARLFSILFNFHVVIFRISSVYDSSREVSINKICRNAIVNSKVTIYGNGEQSRDFIHVSDIIQAINLALNNKLPMGIYNLGTGKDYSINELIDLIEDNLKKSLNREHAPITSVELNKNRIDIRKIRQYGFKPEMSLKKGLKNLIKQIKEEIK